jgi:hypothetical protein
VCMRDRRGRCLTDVFSAQMYPVSWEKVSVIEMAREAMRLYGLSYRDSCGVKSTFFGSFVGGMDQDWA